MAQSEILDDSLEILDCLDRGFSRFGQSVGNVVYWKFQFTTKLSKLEVTKRPDLFSLTIQEIFREGGKIVENALIQELKVKFQIADRNYAGLEDAMNSIKTRSFQN
ncbi:MAG: hypothetical protein OK439_05125 [Thaumarchaeota archaeon]|nr:hypothetical protein [Nitrososphaerota archaeon]